MEDPEGICEEIREYVDMTGCSCHLVTGGRPEKGRGAGRSAGKRRSEEPHADPAWLGRGSERFQQIGGRSLASPTDADADGRSASVV